MKIFSSKEEGEEDGDKTKSKGDQAAIRKLGHLPWLRFHVFLDVGDNFL